MSVEFQELRDAVRQVVDGSELCGAEREYWQQCVELGWLMVSIPEELGGLGMGLSAAVATHLELGRGLCAAPYAAAVIAAEAIASSNLSDKTKRLEKLFGGEQLTMSLESCKLSLTASGFSGTARAVPCADTASDILLWSADHKSLILVDAKRPELQLKATETWDSTRRLFEVNINQLSRNDVTVLAEGEQAKHMVESLLAHRDLALAADAVGAANKLLDITVEHLNTRVQFRRPLAMFQALKHRCADMKAEIVASEALLLSALDAGEKVDAAGVEQANIEKAMAAKQLATSSYARVAEQALQLHGGIGMAVEHPCHLYLKRALLNEQLGRGVFVYPEAAAAALIASVA